MKRTIPELLLAVCIFFACAERAQQQPREPESGGALSASESTAIQSEVRVLSEAKRQELLALQDRIVKNPEDITHRRALGEKAIEAETGVIWTVGRGKIPVSAASPHVAQSQAELAARIDAARWAAYLSEWRKNGFATPFGALNAQASGGEIVSKIMSDSICVVLLKTALQ